MRQFDLKTLIEILILPNTYRVFAFLKKHDGVDDFDRDTDFTPFHLD